MTATVAAARDAAGPPHARRGFLTPVAAARVVIGAIPLTFLASPSVGGYQPSGWGWLIGGGALLASFADLPLRWLDVKRASPYLIFLGLCLLSLAWAPEMDLGSETLLQLSIPLLAYFVGRRVPSSAVAASLARPARLAVGLAFFLVVAERQIGGLPLITVDQRPMGIALALLFIVAVHDRPRASVTLLVGLGAAAPSLMTGSRTASVVILLLMLSSPSLGPKRSTRYVVLAVAVLGVIALSETAAFKERFFFDPEEGSLTEALKFDSAQLNTAGRRELWPRLQSECSHQQPFGHGLGAGGLLSFELSDGVLSHPHNDYLRVWCDVGIAGSVPFWGFFIGHAGLLVALRRRATGTRLQLDAAQGVVALLLFAFTDNPILYTAHFMSPLMLLIGCATADVERRDPERRPPAPVSTRRAIGPLRLRSQSR